MDHIYSMIDRVVCSAKKTRYLTMCHHIEDFPLYEVKFFLTLKNKDSSSTLFWTIENITLVNLNKFSNWFLFVPFIFCTNKRFHKMTIVGAVFEQKNLSDGMRYCTSSNKHWVSNKHCTFGYPHKCLPLISTAPLISAASLNTELTRRITIFYKKLNQNAYEPSMQTTKQGKHC